MNQKRKDQDVPNSLDRDIDGSDMTAGMDPSGAQGSESEHDRSGSGDRASGKGSGISNRPLDEERNRQNRLPERGRAQSEER